MRAKYAIYTEFVRLFTTFTLLAIANSQENCGFLPPECTAEGGDPCSYRCGRNDELRALNLEFFAKLSPARIGNLAIYQYQDDELPVKFLQDKELESLEIVESKITKLDDGCLAMKALTQIWFIKCDRLSFVNPEAFELVANLEAINIKKAKELKYLQLNLSKNKKINRIFIEETAVSTMPMPLLSNESDASKPADIKVVLLANNLFCNCTMVWTKMIQWKESVVDCADPERKHDDNPIKVPDFGCDPPASGLSKFSRSFFVSIFLVFSLHVFC